MKELKKVLVLYEYEALSELPKAVQDLMEKAIEARKQAYAPYSNFQVGAACLLDNGEVIIGSNQENASYPSGLCAERTAIYYAGAKFPEAKIIQIVISAASNKKKTIEPIPPCGACRQAISEYEIRQNYDIEIYFMGDSGKVMKSNSLSNLLPWTFNNSLL
ncbi:cytidine deaminase [Gaetbulibacter saemankumensis]|uniref:cytidine deaminase n=1 Tax=Gaetbulibacter saemankumensis TaxID=311208 RepID=UPI0004149690|nr:cytidine deaminase [Gaetbulibacter saemankumensis]